VSGARDRPLRARWRSAALDRDGALSMAARLAACAYAEYSSDDLGRLRHPPSAATLADWMAMSERAAWRARAELVAAGFLELEHRPGRTSGARLTLPTPARVSGVTPDKTPDKTPDTEADGTSRTRRTSRTPLSPPLKGGAGDGQLLEEEELTSADVTATHADVTDLQEAVRPRRRRDRRTNEQFIADALARAKARDAEANQ
jgi:hypothetical protein